MRIVHYLLFILLLGLTAACKDETSPVSSDPIVHSSEPVAIQQPASTLTSKNQPSSTQEPHIPAPYIEPAEQQSESADKKDMLEQMWGFSRRLVLRKMTENILDFVINSHLRPGSLAPFKKYFSDTGMPGGISVTPQFQKLTVPRKMEALRSLLSSVILELNKQGARASTGPEKKYFLGVLALMEGNIPAAKVAFIEFKRENQGDLKLASLVAVSDNLLKKITLQSLQKLSAVNEMLYQARRSRLIRLYIEDTAQANESLLQQIALYIQRGRASSIDEAIELLKSDSQRFWSDYESKPIVEKDWMITLSSKREKSKNYRIFNLSSVDQNLLLNPQVLHLQNPISSVKLDGGILQATWLGSPDYFRLIVGSNGGTFRIIDGNCYHFPVSQKQKVFVFKNLNLQSSTESLETYYVSPRECAVFNGHYPDDAQRHIQHFERLSHIDRPFYELLRLEMYEGLKGAPTPEARKTQVLDIAKYLRSIWFGDTVSPQLTATLLMDVFSNYRKIAFIHLSADERVQVLSRAERDRADIYSAQIKLMQANSRTAIMPGEIAMRVDRLVMERAQLYAMDLLFESGRLRDNPLVQEAWDIYEDSTNFMGRWKFSDATWNSMADGVLFFAATAPAGFAAGSLAKGYLASLEFVKTAALYGSAGDMASIALVYGSSFVANATVFEASRAFAYQDHIRLANIGMTMIQLSLFELGGAAWTKGLAPKLGLAAPAFEIPGLEMPINPLVKLGDAAGQVLTQTTLMTMFGLGENFLLSTDDPKSMREQLTENLVNTLIFFYGAKFVASTDKGRFENDVLQSWKSQRDLILSLGKLAYGDAFQFFESGRVRVVQDRAIIMRLLYQDGYVLPPHWYEPWADQFRAAGPYLVGRPTRLSIARAEGGSYFVEGELVDIEVAANTEKTRYKFRDSTTGETFELLQSQIEYYSFSPPQTTSFEDFKIKFEEFDPVRGSPRFVQKGSKYALLVDMGTHKTVMVGHLEPIYRPALFGGSEASFLVSGENSGMSVVSSSRVQGWAEIEKGAPSKVTVEKSAQDLREYDTEPSDSFYGEKGSGLEPTDQFLLEF